MPRIIKRILVVRTDRLGDVVLTLPMLPLLRSCFPGVHIGMLLRHYTGEIVVGNRYVDELIWYDDEYGMRPFREMLRALRQSRFDAAILVHPTLRLAWLLLLAGIPLRVGTGYRAYSFLLNRRVYEHRKDAQRHELEYNLRLLIPLGCRIPENPFTPDYAIDIPPETVSSVKQTLARAGVGDRTPRVIIHPGSGGSSKDWPASHFVELGKRLQSRGDVQVLVTGSAADRDRVATVVQGIGEGAVDLSERFSVRELGALIRAADLFVSNSTGPIHIAAAVGTPVLGFYPQIVPLSARRWGPYTTLGTVLVPDLPADCRKCSRGRNRPCECMASIPVERAYGAASELLSQRKGRGRKESLHETA